MCLLYATLYFALHKRKVILTKYATNLLYDKHFIDDVKSIWIPNEPDNNTPWEQFQENLNYGTLRWTTSPLSNSIVFLDLEITTNLVTRVLETKTYQKPTNLFLYIPAHSAQPTRSTKKHCTWQLTMILAAELQSN